MKRIAGLCLALAFLAVRAAGAPDTPKTEEYLKGEALAAAESDAVEIPRPQLSANPNTGPELPMPRETNPPTVPSAAPVEPATSTAIQPRNPAWIILAVMAVLAARFVLKRLLSRSRSS